MPAAKGALTEPTTAAETGVLIDARMSIRPRDGCTCLPDDLDCDDVGLSVNPAREQDRGCQMVLTDGDSTQYRMTTIDEHCPCSVMADHDCVGTLERVQDGTLIFTVTLTDRSVLPDLVADLRDAGATISVDRILAVGDEEDEPQILTEKQREALSRAIELGYYDRPRGATLDDIASDLGITASAASQRLNAVNHRLIERYCREHEPRLIR